MGYYNDVRIATTQHGYDTFVAYVTSQVEKPVLTACKDTYDVFETCGNAVIFGWNDIRWYTGGDPEVVAIEDALDILTREVIPWQFYRIGEELDDIESRVFEPNLEDGGKALDVILCCKREIEVCKFD